MKVQQIMDGMTQANRRLSMKVDELEETGESKAQAERNYKVEYAKALLGLRTDGIPMAIIKEVAMGTPSVADLKYQWDKSEIIFTANKESIKSENTKVDTYRSMLSWEKMEFDKSGIAA